MTHCILVFRLRVITVTGRQFLCLLTIPQVADEYDEDEDIRPNSVQVNLDPKLLLLLREIHYLSQDPFNLKLPGPAR